jgi:hypothetical protein
LAWIGLLAQQVPVQALGQWRWSWFAAEIF